MGTVRALAAAAGLPLLFLACGGGGGGGGTPGAAPAAGGAGAAPILAGSLDVLSYNVAGLPAFLSKSAPETNTRLISPLLNGYTLVLVQEDFWYHADLDAGAAHPHRTTTATPQVGMMNDGLNVFSAFPFSYVDRNIWVACNGVWDAGSDCLADKGFLRIRLEPAPGLEIDVYDLHGDAGRDPLDALARERQYAQLRDHILAFSGGRALIVAGDFNLRGFDPADEPILQTLMAATGLGDSCRTLGCGDDRIDRVLYRSGTGVTIVPALWRLAPEFKDAAGAELSDHKPVHVRLDWTTP